MKHIVMASGGVASFITLNIVRNRHGADNCIALFADTKIEDPDLYRFLDESTAYCGVSLIVIADGRDPWQVFRDVRFIGNTRIDPCSRHLKRDLCDTWITDHYSPDQCIVYVGLDAFEEHRYTRHAERKLPYIYKAPMIDLRIALNNQRKEAYCNQRGIKPPQLYVDGFQHNNCGGFCVKAGLAQFKLLYEKYPERYEWHVQQERLTKQEVPNARPFLRKTIDGRLTYLWLEEYRDQYLIPGTPLVGEEIFEWGGCGCAIDADSPPSLL